MIVLPAADNRTIVSEQNTGMLRTDGQTDRIALATTAVCTGAKRTRYKN